MTQAWVVVRLPSGYEEPVPVAVFATHEEAEAFRRRRDVPPDTRHEIIGPLPVGLAAMVAP